MQNLFFIFIQSCFLFILFMYINIFFVCLYLYLFLFMLLFLLIFIYIFLFVIIIIFFSLFILYVCLPAVIYRGVTVHKIHGSVWYDTVVSWFGMFSIRGAGQLVMSQCWKYFCFKHEGEPMDITQARICTRVYTRAYNVQTLCKIYAGELLITVNSL